MASNNEKNPNNYGFQVDQPPAYEQHQNFTNVPPIAPVHSQQPMQYYAAQNVPIYNQQFTAPPNLAGGQVVTGEKKIHVGRNGNQLKGGEHSKLTYKNIIKIRCYLPP